MNRRYRKARARKRYIFYRNRAVFSRKRVKIDFFVKIVDFDPKTLLMTKNDLSIAIIEEKTICGVSTPLNCIPLSKFVWIRFQVQDLVFYVKL